MWIIVDEMIPTSTFKLRWPGVMPTDVDVAHDGAQSRLYWSTADAVRVAEYWVKEPYEKTLGLTPTGETIDLTDIKPADRAFLPPVVKERKQTAYKVKQWLVTGSSVLSGPHEWPGKFIPIVPVIGSEVPLDQKVYRYGLVRFARDPQQLYNYYRTATAEMIALAPKSPYLVTTTMIGDEQIKRIWDNANTKNRPYLPYKPDPAHPGLRPTREHPPELPVALVQEAQTASEDMKATTGIYDAGLGRRSNETSGVAIQARQHEGDIANYHYIDNLRRSLEHGGRVLIDLIPKVYDNERVIRILGDDDSEDHMPINQEIMTADGRPILLNDLSQARFDVRVSIGKSYSTKRLEAADSLMAFMQAVPQSAPAIGDLVAKNMDWPGSDEIAKRLKNMVPKELLVDPEDPQTQLQPPDPLSDPMVRVEFEAKHAQARKAFAEARRVEMETASMFGQPMLAPEPPMPPPADVMMPGGPQPMPQGQDELPRMQGEPMPFAPDGAPMGLPPGPLEPIPFA